MWIFFSDFELEFVKLKGNNVIFLFKVEYFEMIIEVNVVLF